MNRAIKNLCLAVAVVALGLPVAAAATLSSGKPNILLIMSDEHNASVLGCYGNQLIRTPHLDGLAARGVVFDSFYCTSPLCVPSRQSFTAGKYVSRIGAWNNHRKLPADAPSLPRILNAAGYESFLCGKMHYDAACRYGFTELGNMNKARMNGFGSRRPAAQLSPRPGYSERFDEFHPGQDTGPTKHDQNVTAGAVKFLQQRKPNDKPFFLLAGYLSPHFPLIVPQKYWDHYKDKVPMPQIPPDFLETLPLNYQHLRLGFHNENVPPALVKQGRELYYGLTEWVDEEIGKLLDTLTTSGLASNTIVIYTSDHGENMGEHGLWWKNAMYEQSARVPLIVSWPARWRGGQRRTGACSMVDLVQTLAELGGAKTPSDWDGDSLLAWLDRPETSWKDLAVSEYYAHNIASGFVMLRSGRHKYVYHTPADARHPAQRELYDLQTDPGEFHNLANLPEHKSRIDSLHAALLKELGEDPDVTELRCRTDNAKGYGNKGAAKQTSEE